ncbi:cysteine-rich CWC family protein [Andreprevotia chitinilytica]|uniref:cysteine-rich CWC family protein n=1 Tax=Andreprevotia chitinilytica TaxID=396808 RepID=UPI0005555D42|nr:cysteine-rich CWC family protein [Andreprevotia chitinilytica]
MTHFNSDPPTPVPSPCIGQCALDAGQTCTGCRRTIDEIAAWSQMSEAGKFAVWQRLLALPMVVKAKACSRCGSSFSCGTGGEAGGCWCADLPHELPISGAGDCLCPTCLRLQLQASGS